MTTASKPARKRLAAPASSEPIWKPHASVSKQKKRMSHEEALRYVEKRNELAVQGLSVGLWDWNIVTNDLYWSPRFKDIVGINNSSFRPHLKEFTERLHPDDENHTLDMLKNHLEIHTPYDVEYRLRRTDGSYVWIHACGQAEWDDEGRPLRMVGSVDDISRRKAIEDERDILIEKLAESNVELDRFASIAAHDMQAPLRVVVNFSELLISQHGGAVGEDGKQYLNFLIESAQQMQLMVDDLLEFARVGHDSAESFVTFDPNKELAQVMISLAPDIYKQQAKITHDTLPSIKGSPLQFRRLLENLMSNALKYQKPDKPLKLHISAEDRGAHWCFSVKDNGVGIEPIHLQEIFEPFKRLHPQCERTGTGLGLTICKKIVQNHGGIIDVASTVGQGSTFSFTWVKAEMETSAGLSDILAALQMARAKLVTLVASTDRETQTALVEQIKAATEEVDAKVAVLLANPSISAEMKGKLSDFNSIWIEFQHARNTQIIPAALAGDKEKAKNIAQGIQVERLRKMIELLA